MLARPLIPREHGSWAMLLMPCIIGTAVADAFAWQSILFLVSILGLFCARYPLSLLVRRGFPRSRDQATLWLYYWTVIYTAIFLASGLALLLLDRWLLVILGVLAGLLLATNLYLLRRRLDRSASSELLGIAGLSMTAPGGYYAAAGALDQTALVLWLLTFLYSGSSIFYVRVRLSDRQLASKTERRQEAQRALLVYQAVLLAVVAGLVVLGMAPALTLLAFVPLFYKVLRAVAGHRPHLTVRQVGFVELGHAVIFTVLLILAYWTGGLGS